MIEPKYVPDQPEPEAPLPPVGRARLNSLFNPESTRGWYSGVPGLRQTGLDFGSGELLDQIMSVPLTALLRPGAFEELRRLSLEGYPVRASDYNRAIVGGAPQENEGMGQTLLKAGVGAGANLLGGVGGFALGGLPGAALGLLAARQANNLLFPEQAGGDLIMEEFLGPAIARKGGKIVGKVAQKFGGKLLKSQGALQGLPQPDPRGMSGGTMDKLQGQARGIHPNVPMPADLRGRPVGPAYGPPPDPVGLRRLLTDQRMQSMTDMIPQSQVGWMGGAPKATPFHQILRDLYPDLSPDDLDQLLAYLTRGQ